MRLEFPHVRLFLCNRLQSGDDDCLKAMLEGAYNFGVLPEDALAGLTCPVGGGVCRSQFAARKILEQYVLSDGTFGDEEARQKLAERICANVTKDVESYCRLNNVEHPCGTAVTDEVEGCGKLAPVVFDIMLQHIRRHL